MNTEKSEVLRKMTASRSKGKTCTPTNFQSKDVSKSHVPAFSSGSKRKLLNTFLRWSTVDSPRKKLRRILNFWENPHLSSDPPSADQPEEKLVI